MNKYNIKKDALGNKFYYLDGKLHREEQPFTGVSRCGRARDSDKLKRQVRLLYTRQRKTNMKVYVILFPGFAQSNDSSQEKEAKVFLSASEACKYLNEIIQDQLLGIEEEAMLLTKNEKFLELAKLYDENIEDCFAKIVKML